MQDTVDIPRPAALYRRIAATALRRRLIPKRREAVLPERTLIAEHPGISSTTAAQYTRLLGGEAYDGQHRQSLASVLVHTAGFPLQMALMGRPDFPLPLLGLVHLHNRVEHRRPIPPDVPLHVTVTARHLAAHRRGTQVEIVVDITPAADVQAGETATSASVPADPAWTGVSTYLCRGLHLLEAEDRTDTSESGQGRSASGAGGHASGGSGGDTRLDLPPKTALWHFPAGAGRDYASVSGDYNPIHLSSAAAKAFGMPAAILHGMYAAGMALEGREPEHAGHRWEVAFASPIVLPARVAFGVDRPGHNTAGHGTGGHGTARHNTGGHGTARQQTQASSGDVRFAGWDPRTGREHFRGSLSLPAG